MSGTYASRLRPYRWKGVCGDPEREEAGEVVRRKVAQLVEWLREAQGRCVVHTGAGVSTAAGIPDFRGPAGIWTCEQRGQQAPQSVRFEDARPTLTHMAVKALMDRGLVRFVCTQNVDGLHLRSGVPREQLAEIHGSCFAEYCEKCQTEWWSWEEIQGMGLRSTGKRCLRPRCDGELRDRICDWDSPLPVDENDRAIEEHKQAELTIVLGSSLRIRPAGNYPMRTSRKNGKSRPGRVVIVNLQKTHLDRSCHLRFFTKVDHVMRELMAQLEIEIPAWDPETHKARIREQHYRLRSLDAAEDDDDSPPRKRVALDSATP